MILAEHEGTLHWKYTLVCMLYEYTHTHTYYTHIQHTHTHTHTHTHRSDVEDVRWRNLASLYYDMMYTYIF
jgi:hypothetical protein